MAKHSNANRWAAVTASPRAAGAPLATRPAHTARSRTLARQISMAWSGTAGTAGSTRAARACIPATATASPGTGHDDVRVGAKRRCGVGEHKRNRGAALLAGIAAPAAAAPCPAPATGQPCVDEALSL